MDKKTEYLLKLAQDAESQGNECSGYWVKDEIINILAGKEYKSNA